MPTLPQEISYSYKVKEAGCKVSGVVVNGGVAVAKAFVAVFKAYNASGALIDGPYAGLSFSKLGAYHYVQGGSTAAPYSFSYKLTLPQGATRLSVSFAPWESAENIQFAALPVVELATVKKPAQNKKTG